MNDPNKQLSYTQFLDFIADKDEPYEYVDGHPVAMGRPSTIHQRIVAELVFALKGHLRGQRCDVYADIRLWVGDRDRVPDLAVTCDEYDLSQAQDIIHSPKLIVEVLSPKRSEELDTKRRQYQSRPSVLEYIVIDSRRRWVQRYARTDATREFDTDPIRISGSFVLASVNYMLDIDELYRLVRFPIE